MIRCVLCRDPQCDRACAKLKPSDLLRSIWFKNEQTAALRLPDENPCLTCSEPCKGACIRPGEVPVKDLICRLYNEVRPECETPEPKDKERLRICEELKRYGYIVIKGSRTVYYSSEMRRIVHVESYAKALGLRFEEWELE